MRLLITMLNLTILLSLALLDSCSPSNNTVPLGSYSTIEAFPNLAFTRPVDLQNAGDNSNRIFVVEQKGVIYVFENNAEVSESSVFLDIESRVDDGGNEEGLLGLAFHPDYENNGQFFVNYTASVPNRTVISRFTVSQDDPNKADPTSEEIILEFNQPYSNHNGGQLAFGPDGFLYIAVGDGGSGGDPQGNGQNRNTLLGSILRIDINKQGGELKYGIPSGNPFVGNENGFREEIFAYGLRNPWRISFDPASGRLWAGDVGQNAYEEIDIIRKGKNYGWNIMEGKHCYSPFTDCVMSGLTLPIVEYGRSEGISVTGGYVYRGSKLKGLVGKYIYADYGSSNVWALDYTNMSNPTTTILFKASFNIPSFGIDEGNELYLCGFDGKIYKMEETDSP